MASPVQAKAVVLYAKIGSVYYPVACAKDVNVTYTSSFLELAPRTSTAWREFEYERLTGEISGSGITVIDTNGAPYSIFDVIGQQFSLLKFLVKFSAYDPSGNYKVFECRVLVEEINLAGSASALSNYSYKLRITGDVLINSTPVENTNPQINIFEYNASGGESSVVVSTASDNATVIVVYVNGVSKKVIDYPDGYTANQVQYDASTQTLVFGTALSVNDYIKVIYVDLSIVQNDFALEDGNGFVVEDGFGNEILTQ